MNASGVRDSLSGDTLASSRRNLVMSADLSTGIIVSLCGVCVRVGLTTPPKVQGPETGFLKKIPYLLRIENCSRHADLFVHLFPEPLQVRYPHPTCENFSP